MLELGITSCFAFEEKNFEELQKNGVKHIEISRPYYEYSDIDFHKIGLLSSKYNVNLWSCHLPFSGIDVLDIASINKGLRQKTVEWWREIINRASSIGITKFIAHPSSEPKSTDPLIRNDELKYSMESLSELAEYASKKNGVIAVENLPRTCLGSTVAELKQILSADSRLGFCFDTNHSLDEDYRNYPKELGEKLLSVHISDYDFRNEKHWLPFEGKIDWFELIELFKKIEYSGPFLYELDLVTPKTLNRRDLTFSDYKENYDACFNKKEYKVIGSLNYEECEKNAYYLVPKF